MTLFIEYLHQSTTFMPLMWQLITLFEITRRASKYDEVHIVSRAVLSATYGNRMLKVIDILSILLLKLGMTTRGIVTPVVLLFQFLAYLLRGKYPRKGHLMHAPSQMTCKMHQSTALSMAISFIPCLCFLPMFSMVLAAILITVFLMLSVISASTSKNFFPMLSIIAMIILSIVLFMLKTEVVTFLSKFFPTLSTVLISLLTNCFLVRSTVLLIMYLQLFSMFSTVLLIVRLLFFLTQCLPLLSFFFMVKIVLMVALLTPWAKAVSTLLLKIKILAGGRIENGLASFARTCNALLLRGILGYSVVHESSYLSSARGCVQHRSGKTFLPLQYTTNPPDKQLYGNFTPVLVGKDLSWVNY